MSVQAFSTVIPFTPPIASLSLSLSPSLSVFPLISHPFLSSTLAHECFLIRLQPSALREWHKEWWTEWGTNCQLHSCRHDEADTLAGHFCICCTCANTALSQFLCVPLLSSHLSIFPSFLLSLSALRHCWSCDSLPSAHCGGITQLYCCSNQIRAIWFCELKVSCRLFHVIFYCLFLITTSFCYSGRIQKEIIYRKHWHSLSLLISQRLKTTSV